MLDEVRERALDAAQVGDAAPHLLEPSGGNALDAAAIAAVFELQQGVDLVQGESQLLRALHEPDATHVMGSVAAYGPKGFLRLRDETPTLVEPHCFDTDARFARDGCNRESC